jgi:hypothetical protein
VFCLSSFRVIRFSAIPIFVLLCRSTRKSFYLSQVLKITHSLKFKVLTVLFKVFKPVSIFRVRTGFAGASPSFPDRPTIPAEL